MKIFRLFIMLAALGSLMGCTQKLLEERQNGFTALEVHAGLSTRAADAYWTQDRIGVMVTAPDDGLMYDEYKNAGYKTDSEHSGYAAFEAIGEPIYFNEDGQITFAAYAPYTASSTDVLPGADGIIAGDTESQADDYTDVDFLYASGQTASMSNPGVAFTFKHVMSKIIINIETAGDAALEADLPTGTYYLGGVKLQGEFDVNPASEKCGAAYATGTTADSWAINGNWAMTAGGDYPVTFSAIVFPQTPEEMPFSAVIGGQTYGGLDLVSTLPEKGMEAGNEYVYTITATRTGLTVNGCTIQPWNNNDGLSASVYQPYKEPLVLTYSVSADTGITLPLYGEVDCMVDWGDGSELEAVTSQWPTHTFATAGEYDVEIVGTVTALKSLGSNGTAIPGTYRITAVKQWGRNRVDGYESRLL